MYNFIIVYNNKLVCEYLNISSAENILELLWDFSEDYIKADWDIMIKFTENIVDTIWEDYLVCDFEGSDTLVYIWVSDEFGNNMSNFIEYSEIENFINKKISSWDFTK